MAINAFYNEILTDHNLHPMHKYNLKDPNLILEGLNPSCGDDIVLQLKMNEDGIIEDGSYNGDGCAVSSEEEIEELEEAGSLRDISHMPSRVKCAVLGWHTMEELVDKEPIQNAGEHSGEAVSTE